MLKSPVIITLAPLMVCLALAANVTAQTRTEPFDAGWRFTRDSVKADVAIAPDFDDSGWDVVRLPHDWAIAGPFDPSVHGSTGKLPWKGEGWYRATLELDESDAGKRVYLDFDGAMAFPTVYVNGAKAGGWDYGYAPFRIDVTDHVRWGGPNVVAVHLDTRNWGSRWYPGAGLYRSVSVTIAEPVHLARWGVRVTTDGDELTGVNPGKAWVETTVENHEGEPRVVVVDTRLVAPDGSVVDTQRRGFAVRAYNRTTVEQEFEVENPRLWDIDDPARYTVETRLSGNRGTLEERTTRFGFRTFAFTADDGFHLNGRRVQLHGVNLHHDLGPLGAAFNRTAAARQLRIMQEMGTNALRTSHNPPARGVIELADELGILVWDEMFDKWDWTAGRTDGEPALEDMGHRVIRNTVERDRNSPSVVTWSIGNEIGGAGGDYDGVSPERTAMMSGFVRAHDDTRPVTMGMHIPELVDGKNFAPLDMMGWNYARRYANYRATWPDRPIIYSESASALSTRGYYEPDLERRPTDYRSTAQVSSYDLSAAPWSDIADKEFALMEQDSFVAGEFVWTGIDYLGEPTPFDREARSSYFGIADLCGFPKDRYWLYRSHWRPDETTVHILPHWNWPDRVGRNVPVFVYTNGDSAELFLNGRSLGMRRKGEVPARAANFATVGGAGPVNATASSGAETSALAHDDQISTGWRPDAGDTTPWWQIDLGTERPIRFVALDTPLRENLYAYTLTASSDGTTWTTLAEKPTSRYPMWSGPSRVFHEVEADARYLRVTFTGVRDDAPMGLNTFGVYSEPIENDYYDVTYDYRLRWNEVTYEPGELRAVAYRDGREIGETRVSTTGKARSLRMTAEPVNTGDDLVFVKVEAVDDRGRVHPLADHEVRFSVSGPGSIAGLCNGNPMSFEPHQGTTQRLFYGMAQIVVRPESGSGGVLEITVAADGLKTARLRVAVEH